MCCKIVNLTLKNPFQVISLQSQVKQNILFAVAALLLVSRAKGLFIYLSLETNNTALNENSTVMSHKLVRGTENEN